MTLRHVFCMCTHTLNEGLLLNRQQRFMEIKRAVLWLQNVESKSSVSQTDFIRSTMDFTI